MKINVENIYIYIYRKKERKNEGRKARKKTER